METKQEEAKVGQENDSLILLTLKEYECALTPLLETIQKEGQIYGYKRQRN